jgi:hypothetical protein
MPGPALALLTGFLWALTLAFVSACGGAGPRPDPILDWRGEASPAFSLPPDLALPPAAFDFNSREVVPGEPLADLWVRVRAQLQQRGLSPWEVELIEPTHPASGFLRWIAARQSTPAGPVLHLVLLTPARWTADRIDRVLESFWYLAGHLPADAGIPRFHLVSPEPAPFPLAWWLLTPGFGALESRLQGDFLELDPTDPAQIPRVTPACADRLAPFGLPTGVDPGQTLVSMDALLAAMPRAPSPDDTFRPLATLACTGLLLGDAFRTAHPDWQWIAGADVQSRWPALRRPTDQAVIRPVEFVFQAWGHPGPPVDRPLRAWWSLVQSRL